VLPLFAAAPALAQSIPVSNLGQTAIFTPLTVSQAQATSFTTGFGQGYELSGIETKFTTIGSPQQMQALRAELWSPPSNGEPGSKLLDLRVPSGITANTNVVFAAPPGARLAASRTYLGLIYIARQRSWA
jgi:hypothetical protein